MTYQTPNYSSRTMFSHRGPYYRDKSEKRIAARGPIGINDVTGQEQQFRTYYHKAQHGLICQHGTSLELFQPKNCIRTGDGWFCTNGPYSVTVSRRGEIRVKKDDWLSKYSAAIYNNFFHIHEFGTRQRNGLVLPVDEIDRISEGGVIYHMPTYYQHIGNAPQRPECRRQPVFGEKAQLDEAEKKKRVMDILSAQYELSGERLKTLSKAIDIVGKVDDALTLAEIAGLVSEASLISSIGTVTGLAGVLLFPIGSTISLINANEIGERVYGYRAIAYTTTAYAFSENRVPNKSEAPDKSFVIRERIDRSGADAAELAALDKAWKLAKDSTWSNLEQTVSDRHISRDSYRIYLRACGEDNAQKFCKVILKGFEGELKGKNPAVFETWKRNYMIEYPN